MKPYNMLKKTKVRFIIAWLALCTVSCNRAETIKSKTESPQASAPSSAATSSNATKPKPRIMLDVGYFNDIDKLLLQVNRATQENKDAAAAALEGDKIAMEKERQEGLHGGRSGLTKITCLSPMDYPTVDGLANCAEAISLEQGSFEGKLKNFKGSSRLYRTALLFGERTNASLPAAKRQNIEKNIACLNAFIKAPNPEKPGCELVRVSLLDPGLPGGKILPSPTREQ
jgi:hypothetical protein